jgi:hypothetical protein
MSYRILHFTDREENCWYFCSNDLPEEGDIIVDVMNCYGGHEQLVYVNGGPYKEQWYNSKLRKIVLEETMLFEQCSAINTEKEVLANKVLFERELHHNQCATMLLALMERRREWETKIAEASRERYLLEQERLSLVDRMRRDGRRLNELEEREEVARVSYERMQKEWVETNNTARKVHDEMKGA